jgi:hypothetical protein
MFLIKVILDWSALRISIVVLTPVLFSLKIGLWLNFHYWSNAIIIQTAWGVVLYINIIGVFKFKEV